MAEESKAPKALRFEDYEVDLRRANSSSAA
jgi:hypothetical protein